MAEFSTVLGDRIQHLIIGGASSSNSLKSFLLRCFKCPVYDGYGATECGSIASNNVSQLTHAFLTTQKLFPNVEVKLVSVPEMGYTTSDIPYPRGEVYVKTKQMITGYYKDDQTTSENFHDGWFKTGYESL